MNIFVEKNGNTILIYAKKDDMITLQNITAFLVNR